MKLFGRFSGLLAVTALVLVAAPQVFAYIDDTSDQCVMPAAERKLIASLDLVLRQTNFDDCRITVTEDGMSFDHGAFHGWVNFNSRRTEVTPVGSEVVVSGSRYADDDTYMYQDKLTFVPAKDQVSLSEVVYVQSEVDHRNTGTLAHPTFETVYTPITTIHCKAN